MKRIGLTLVVFAVLCFAVAFTGCDDEEYIETGFIFNEEIFLANWEAWESKNILNYSFNIKGKQIDESTYLTSSDYEVKIIVKNGVMDSFEYIGDNENFIEPRFTSISDMYESIYKHIENEKKLWDSLYYYNRNICSIKFIFEYNNESSFITYYDKINRYPDAGIIGIPIRKDPIYGGYISSNPIYISNFTILEIEPEVD